MKKRIEIRIKEELKNKWLGSAKDSNSTLTNFIINKIEGNKSVFLIKKIEGFFNKIGNDRKKAENNLNQISRNINISKGVNQKQMMKVENVLNEYKSVIEEQNKLIIKVFKELHK
ncbi:hypothetical protein [Polaribacter sp. IC063]|uniref:hypothetical protein n=1 Tax=Polaribacter sp. IC063 TaxID=57031 RepID=UPI0011BEFFC8|nr:hypothetical protein [Polaribacter sp. IC063]TXD53914.1 hypothetical protein ES043_02485 [Polaribacter sp. IC063]